MTAAPPIAPPISAPTGSVDPDAYAVASSAMSSIDPAPLVVDAPPVIEGRGTILYHYAELLAPLRGLIALADGELERRWRPAWRRFYRDAKHTWQSHYERLHAAALEELGDDSDQTRQLLESAIAAGHARIALDELMRPGAAK